MGNNTYSFLSVVAAIVGPGGNINLGAGAGSAEEGIEVEATEEINTMTIGADGTPMHSLHGDKSGKFKVSLLKVSPTNQKLQNMYNLQTAAPATHGVNTLTIADKNRGDTITGQFVAFAKAPATKYTKDGGVMEWEFHAGIVGRVLGAG